MSDRPPGDPWKNAADADRTVIVPKGQARARPPNPQAAPPAPKGAATPALPATPRPAGVAAAPQPDAPMPAKPASMPQPGVSAAPPLIAAAMPLLLLLARVRNTASQPDAANLQDRAIEALRGFEQSARAAGVPPEHIKPAHFALCAALDDAVLATPWGAQSGWARQTLVWRLHPHARSDTGGHFYSLEAQARAGLPATVPLAELLFLCLSLGYLGQYRREAGGGSAAERIRAGLAQALADYTPPPADLSPSWRGVNTPWRPRRRGVPLWVIATAAAAVAGAAFFWLAADTAERAETVFARVVHAPPERMPDLIYPTPLQPSAQPVPQQGRLDRLARALAGDAQAGSLTISGTEALPTIRVPARQLFGSADATLLPSAGPLLGRIADALAAEGGSVTVAAYTDNQKRHTVAFPSIYQLSLARARAAAAVVARTASARLAVTAEGRGDVDPLAANTTPEGREANRRIEFVLRPGGP
jgi:type VI secretion system protein ImpK